MKQQKENSSTDQTKKTPIKRYAFAQKEGDDFSCIKLLDGQYEGIIKYDKVKFAPDANKKGEIPLKFTYDIYLNPNKVEVEDENFTNYIGDILVELVENQLENKSIIFNE